MNTHTNNDLNIKHTGSVPRSGTSSFVSRIFSASSTAFCPSSMVLISALWGSVRTLVIFGCRTCTITGILNKLIRYSITFASLLNSAYNSRLASFVVSHNTYTIINVSDLSRKMSNQQFTSVQI